MSVAPKPDWTHAPLISRVFHPAEVAAELQKLMAVTLAALLQQLRRDDALYDADLEPEVDDRDVEDDKELRSAWGPIPLVCLCMHPWRQGSRRMQRRGSLQSHRGLPPCVAGSRQTWSEAWC